MTPRRRTILISALVLYSGAVFVLDVATPQGIDIWLLNLPVVLVPVLFRNRRMVVYVALACSVMLAVGWIGSPAGGNPTWWEFLNRGMGLAAVWLIAVMAINFIKKTEQLDGALGRLLREMTERGQLSRALEQREEQLRLAMEGAGMGIVDVNLQTGKVEWSATYLRLLGYQTVSPRETAMDLWISCIHPEDSARVLEARQQALQRHSNYSIEYRIHRADTQAIAWLEVYGCYYYNASGEGIRFVGVAFDITRRKELERDAVQSEVLAIAEREQRRIGQELHDGVGQELTGLGLMAQALAQRLAEADAEKRVALRLATGLDTAHQKVRELSRGLIPVHVETRGLSAALDDLAASASAASGVSVVAECPDWVELPDHATATELFHIAQEAVSNALRHGRPRHVRLSLHTEPTGLRLRISDDGIGMAGEADKSDGLGLRIMRYRAGLIRGVLQITLSPAGGTVVTCTVPRSKSDGKEELGSCLGQGQSLDCG